MKVNNDLYACVGINVGGVTIKNKLALSRMRVAGKLLSSVMKEVASFVVEGVSTFEIDEIIENKMRRIGLKPECKGYGGYKHASCISVNNTIVHGVPSKQIILKSGDFVKIDIVGSYKGYCADMARAFFVGDVSPLVKQLAETAQRALDAGIEKACVGNHLHDISFAIQSVVENEGFGIVTCFAGHGIGKAMHEAPDVPNYGDPGTGLKLREGMTLAIEPMITSGDAAVTILSDGWTATTKDGGLAAHVEDTVIVLQDSAEIITRA